MNTDGTDYNAYADYGAYQTEIAKDAPVIEYHGSGSLAPGTVNVADYVKAHDYNGQELAVKLLKFCDSDGNELPDQMDAVAGTITFHTAGIYSFTVKAMDSGNRKTTAVIRVPADAAAFTLLKEQLEEGLGTLTEREQKVLTLRFGLEDGRARTLEEVGREFNVTRERIRQIEAKALRKLRHPSRSRKLKDYLE